VHARVNSRRVVIAVLLLAASVTGRTAAQTVAAATLSGQLSKSDFVQTWSAGPFPDKGNPVAESSPMVATLDRGGPAVVVGDRTGYLYAYHLADGSPVPGWPTSDGGAPIDATPSVAPMSGGTLDEVFVGAGNAQAPGVGGYEAFGPSGQLLWRTTVSDPPSDQHPAYAVQASLTVAGLQGGTDVFAGSLDQLSYALDASDGSPLPGWPYFSADSVFSTAAVGDLYGTGQEELVMGGASTAGLAMGQAYPQGGQLRVLNANGGLVCDQNPNQEVDSSPAIGGFLAGGAPGIVVGTGSYYKGASDTNTLEAFTPARCGLVWSVTLDGSTGSSPALADVMGNGQLDVVEGTSNSSGGSVWVLDGATGATIWHEPVVGQVIGSVVAADLTGAGYQDLLVPTLHGVEVLDGRTGAEVTVLGPYFGFQNSPLVTADPNGTIGITIAGYNGYNQGVIAHYEIPGSNGALAVGPGSWPMFHHDPQLTGASSVLPDLGRVTPTGLAAQRGSEQVSLSWTAPASATGFNVYMGTAPGHEQPAPLNGGTPVSGTSFTATGLANGRTYYFEVTALNSVGEGAPSNEVSATPAGPPAAPSGLVAAPGNAQVSLTWAKPSTGGAPIKGYNVYESTSAGAQGQLVATVPATSYTATGLINGTTYYFEVTAFNAVGEGSPSAPAAATPIAPTTTTIPTTTTTTTPPAPLGYWVAEASGAVAAFGHVRTYAGAHPATPVVAIVPTADYRGYWLATRGGGVLAFGDASPLGSLGGKHLNSPIVGMAATPNGRGYWLVAADGGMFAFGDAGFFGSEGGKHLNSPIVGMAATPNGRGYWLVAADGGMFAFGDAGFRGSMGGKHLNQPIVGMAATPDGHGYWLVARDGGVFAFPPAPYFGALNAKTSHLQVVGMAG
jgi:hypothetical protein